MNEHTGPDHISGADRNEREARLIHVHQILTSGNLRLLRRADVEVLITAVETQMYFEGGDPPNRGATVDPDIDNPDIWGEGT